ncbi:OpgC family protein [Maritimibacter sp. DP1N21-5]|uniref:OpgC family protein n=1 Tax=Maritimibacter sp. DP1N21-5 TaxID=2836867 RepID=UPI001C4538B2|nr:OpgC domain-containing protein [Maritimibacter sp. DP1N21-5]MBV7407977.1 OpgC domain-containing protein [Maritimibacter sp. DP1N21-5]
MSRPETPTIDTKRARDPRIDAFRGLLLAMIFIDHVPGNPYESWLTIRNWGFSDAAESFFIMSGIAAGIAYSGRLTDGITSLWQGIAPVWKRAWVLYLSHIFLTIAGIAIFAIGAKIFSEPSLLMKNNLRQVFINTDDALIGIVTLGHQIGYVNILPAYSALLLAAPLVIVAGRRWPWQTFAVSLAFWFVTGLFRLNFPAYPNPGGWFFNPFAWQFIFVVGLLSGMAARRGDSFVPKSRALFWIAAGWLVFVLAWRYVPGLGPFMNARMADLRDIGFPFHVTSHDKTFLPVLRMTHALALAYVVASLPLVRHACAHWAAEPLRVMGRQGLLIFSAGALLSLAGQVLLQAYPDQPLVPWLYIPAGILALIAIAWLGDWKRRIGQPEARSLVAKGPRPLPAE